MNDDEFEDWLNTTFQGALACCRLFSIRYVLLRRAKRNIKRSQVQFVNSVFKGHLNKIINLEKIHLPNSKMYHHQPKMLTISHDNVKLLIFNSGKFRIMGYFNPPTINNACKQLRKRFHLRSKLQYQTSTVVFRISKRPINLAKLFNHLRLVNKTKYIGHYESEMFPSIALKLWSPIHCNVFASGKVVLTGVKCCDYYTASCIQCYLYKQCHK
jgi:TATA-box binding protein (TBP) (component of TFIID and TFIIIB)